MAWRDPKRMTVRSVLCVTHVKRITDGQVHPAGTYSTNGIVPAASSGLMVTFSREQKTIAAIHHTRRMEDCGIGQFYIIFKVAFEHESLSTGYSILDRGSLAFPSSPANPFAGATNSLS